jgi:hypothetical protein
MEVGLCTSIRRLLAVTSPSRLFVCPPELNETGTLAHSQTMLATATCTWTTAGPRRSATQLATRILRQTTSQMA